MNPNQFNYAAYLETRRIFRTTFVAGNKWVKVSEDASFALLRRLSKTRASLLKNLELAGLDDDELAIASAMILGFDELMQEELQKKFVVAGAMHLLCVSGLHVGILFLVLDFLLGLLLNRGKLRQLKVLLLVVSVWLYAFLTGFSPSVQRASVMITVFILGGLLGRRGNAFNSLAASAVILLLIDPLVLFSVGFQLSYAAVTGILVFHQPFYKLLRFKNSLLDKTWSVFVLGIAAQLGAAPIAMHYFHFFPTYFWLANLFTFPLAFVIVGTGVLFLLFSWIPFVSVLLGKLIGLSVLMLNKTVSAINLLPLNGMDSIYFPWSLVILSYLMFGSLIFLLIRRSLRALLPFVTTVMILAALVLIGNYRIHNQNHLSIYSIKGHTAVALIRSEKAIILADTALMADGQKIDYNLKEDLIRKGVTARFGCISESVEWVDLFFEFDGVFGYFGSLSFMVLDGPLFNYRDANPIGIDLLIVSGKGGKRFLESIQLIDPGRVIIDGSVSKYYKSGIIKTCDSLGLRYHDVLVSGALEIDLFQKNIFYLEN